MHGIATTAEGSEASYLGRLFVGRMFTGSSGGRLWLRGDHLELDSRNPGAQVSLARSNISEVLPPSTSLKSGEWVCIEINARDGRRLQLYGMPGLARSVIIFACLIGASEVRGPDASIWIVAGTIFLGIIVASIIETAFTFSRLRKVASRVQAWVDEGAPQRSA